MTSAPGARRPSEDIVPLPRDAAKATLVRLVHALKMRSHEVPNACSRAASRIEESNSGSSINRAVYPTNSSKSRATNPVLPCRTVNCGPPRSVTTAGTPEAKASSTTNPNVSVSDGNASTSKLANVRDNAGPLSTPVNSACRILLCSHSCSAPSPTITKRKSL